MAVPVLVRTAMAIHPARVAAPALARMATALALTATALARTAMAPMPITAIPTHLRAVVLMLGAGSATSRSAEPSTIPT
jgi:hypothetical protein